MAARAIPAVACLAWMLVTACGGSPTAPSSPSSPSAPPATSPGLNHEAVIDALDIVTWNMTATGGASYRRQDLICRWELPVRVYLAQ